MKKRDYFLQDTGECMRRFLQSKKVEGMKIKKVDRTQSSEGAGLLTPKLTLSEIGSDATSERAKHDLYCNRNIIKFLDKLHAGTQLSDRKFPRLILAGGCFDTHLLPDGQGESYRLGNRICLEEANILWTLASVDLSTSTVKVI
jgi:hypothetical protein